MKISVWHRDRLIDEPTLETDNYTAWTFKIICPAKKILHIQMPLYVWRTNTNSTFRRNPVLRMQTLNFFVNMQFDYMKEPAERMKKFRATL